MSLLVPYEKSKSLGSGGSMVARLKLKGIDETVKEIIEGSLNMLIDEQTDVNMVSGKILNKVNLVNDWGTRLKEELGRKPTVEESGNEADFFGT